MGRFACYFEVFCCLFVAVCLFLRFFCFVCFCFVWGFFWGGCLFVLFLRLMAIVT